MNIELRFVKHHSYPETLNYNEPPKMILGLFVANMEHRHGFLVYFNVFCSRLSFQSCCDSEKSWRVEIMFLSKAKGRFAYCQRRERLSPRQVKTGMLIVSIIKILPHSLKKGEAHLMLILKDLGSLVLGFLSCDTVHCVNLNMQVVFGPLPVTPWELGL